MLLRPSCKRFSPRPPYFVREAVERIVIPRDAKVGVVPLQLLHQREMLRLQRVVSVPATPLADAA